MYQPLKLLHYTRGGPWFGRMDQGADLWMEELTRMLVGANPKASAQSEWPPVNPPQVHIYFKLDEMEVN